MSRPWVALVLVTSWVGACAEPSDEPTPATVDDDSDDDDNDDDGDDDTDGDDGDDPADPTDDSGGSTTPGSGGETTDGTTTGDSGGTSGGVESSGGADDGSSSGDSGSGACADLEACCDAIGADLYAGCITVVNMGSPDLCDSILTTYHGEGYCTGEPYCDDLADCCPELPPGVGWQDTCEYYADLGNQPQCLMLIGDYQLSDYCL